MVFTLKEGEGGSISNTELKLPCEASRCSGARRPKYVDHFVNLPSRSFYKDGALLFISFNASHRWATLERKSPLATRYLPPWFCSQHFRQMSVISHPTWRMMAGNANENKQRIWPGDKVYRGATAFLKQLLLNVIGVWFFYFHLFFGGGLWVLHPGCRQKFFEQKHLKTKS